MDLWMMGVLLVVVAGGYSWGYFFLRFGWPTVRILEDAYKTGWSVMLGSFFGLLVLLGSALMDAFFPVVASRTMVAGVTVVFGALFIGGIYLFKHSTKSATITAVVPIETLHASTAAAELLDKASSDPQIVSGDMTQEKIDQIKAALARAMQSNTDEGNQNG